ncbi:hypothetical protein Hypma_004099 [Hypsizygus marmoreus]|uniref:Uncharacterized protein n=1 Tax=Hypsizygus marmoreus TaxID=39966 RepID=A0A369K6P2_HYPMA|nr:hypothetical protein Hypma_004099 [Hypsizygus marmoreus]
MTTWGGRRIALNHLRDIGRRYMPGSRRIFSQLQRVTVQKSTAMSISAGDTTVTTCTTSYPTLGLQRERCEDEV